MSDVQATPAVAAAVPAEETVTAPAATKTEETPLAVPAETPATSAATPSAPALVAADAAPAAAATSEAETETKQTEPVTEGHLGYKAPGLLKQFIFANKDFWFSDEPVTAQHLQFYLRGEKAEIAHPVVAWAGQSGKGLLFFVKKGETSKTNPAGVLPLYDATDLKKSSPHEFTFRLHNQQHSFKATSDAERDGWYQSIEKAIEIGKANKESVHESEGYRAELKKLNSPSGPAVPNSGAATASATSGGVAGAGAAASSGPKKSTDLDRAEGATRSGSTEGEEDLKKKNKSRSTSRGVLNRFRGKKEELEQKVEEKKEEKKIEAEEKKIEAEEKKEEKKLESTPATTEETAAPASTSKDQTAEAAAVSAIAGGAVTEERSKPAKRGSIFGSLKAGFKSPVKEKEQKDAELKTDAVVTDAAPQLPETATAAETAAPAGSSAAHTETTPAIAEPVAEPEAAKETPETVSTPNREKKTFLSFMNKRERSISPSAPKETAETKPESAAIVEATKTADASHETPAATTASPAPISTAATENKSEEKTADEVSPSTNKRQSVFGELGRRASKMISRVQQPAKKENAAPSAATESKAAEEPVAETAAPVATETTTTSAEPVVENKPEPVNTSAPAPVAASA